MLRQLCGAGVWYLLTFILTEIGLEIIIIVESVYAALKRRNTGMSKT